MASGYSQGNSWGLKGSEDLGGGVKAVFQLENGFEVNNGKLNQGGREFGRQAYVGLSSETAGTLTMGRQYDSVVDYLAPLTANGNWAGYLFSHPYDNDNTDDTFRIDNAVKYTSISYNGLQFGGLYGFSNSTGFSNNRAYSIGASYTNGPLAIAAAFMNINKVGANTSGAVTTDDASFFATRERVFGAGINYTIASATLGFVYTNSNYSNPTGNAYLSSSTGLFPGASSLKFNNFEINGKYQFTPAFYVGAMYTYTQGKYDAASGDASPKWHQFGLMADYNLSSRTDVYVQGTYQKVAGGQTGTVLDNAFVTGTQGSSSTSKQFVARVALRHKF
jgi:predicted porin